LLVRISPRTEGKDTKKWGNYKEKGRKNGLVGRNDGKEAVLIKIISPVQWKAL